MICVVEDDPNIREIEVYAMKDCHMETKEASCAKEFWKLCENEVPELVLLDIMLPDEDGLEIVRKLRSDRMTKHIPILMVTAKTTEIDKVKGLDMGADDYMTKPFGVMELISRVKALLRRSQIIPEEEVIQVGPVTMDQNKRKVSAYGKACELTYKEYELLHLLMQNAGIVISRDVILNRVWGTDYEGESRTIDMHIKTLRKKLKEAGAMIQTVRNVGYVFNEN